MTDRRFRGAGLNPRRLMWIELYTCVSTPRSLLLGILLALFLISGVLFNPSYAGEMAVLELKPGKSSYSLEPYYAFFVDETSKLKLNDVLNEDNQSRFQASGGESLNLGVIPYSCWLKIVIKNPRETVQNLVLELGTSTINSATLYDPVVNGEYKEKTTGDMHPISGRDYFHRHANFGITIEAGQEKVIYMRLQTEAILETSLTLFTEKRFVASLPVEYLLLGLFYASFLVAILYNLFIYFSLRDLNYLLYVLYAASFMSLWIYLDGLGQMFLWPESPWQQVWGTRIANTTTCLFMVLFTSSFFSCRSNAPRLYKIFAAIALLCIFNTVMVCILPLVDYKGPVRLAWLISIPVIIFTAFVFLRRGYKRARYFLAAWLFVLAGAAVFMVDMYLAIIPSSFFTRYSWRFASVAEIILLSLALADRINELKEKNEQAQVQALEAEMRLSEGLEEKVAERTRDLQKALAEVKQLSGLLPICSNCKRIRNEQDYWQQVEDYISQHSDASFTHGICPDCAEQLYKEFGIKK